MCEHCEQSIPLPNGTIINMCMYYSKVIRTDHKHWAHYPECTNENCPLVHPDLLLKMLG